MEQVVNYFQSGRLTSYNQTVLMSGSPRRQELLHFLHPQVSIPQIDERQIEEKYMAEFAALPFLQRAAQTCCEITMDKLNIPLEPDTLYIAADTIVVVDDQIYNKPSNLNDAKQMIMSYFGRTHHVVTSVCLKMCDYIDTFYTVTEVEFVPYYQELESVIDDFVQTGSPLDKSGGYAIQELDPRFVRRIHGDIHTVIGMPVAEVSSRLHSHQ